MSLLLKSLESNLSDFRPDKASLITQVLAGLQQPVKKINAKFFYDEQGSKLFDQICTLQEYYPTRTETEIMQDYIDEIAEVIGTNAVLVEYGSGSSHKTKILLDHLPTLAAYIPIDISKEHLIKSATKIDALYPYLDVIPISADYTHHLELPAIDKPISHKVVYFPGSTIGNFQPYQALDFLNHVAEVCGENGGLLIGVDLKKDPNILHQAYNDQEGVTAAFNLNVLTHLNKEFGCDFNLDKFCHYAFFNPEHGRVEMRLISLETQVVHLNDTAIVFREHESIITEYSYKYTVELFEALAARANFRLDKAWIDNKKWFSVLYLTWLG